MKTAICQTIEVPRQRGIALAELMVVVAFIGLLTSIAVPNYIKARSSSQKAVCICNLQQLDNAKQKWAADNRKPDNAKPKIADILPYLQWQRMPVCPTGGKYSLQRLSRDPYCSNQAAGHNLKTLYSDPDQD